MYLNCHTWFSLRYGTFSEEALCRLAKQLGITSLAITDINNTSACLNFLKIAPEYGIRPLLGIDFRNDHQTLYVGIAKNNKGYRELNQYLSYHLQHKIDFPSRAPYLKDCYFIYPLNQALLFENSLDQHYEKIGVGITTFNRFRFSKFNSSLYRKQLVFCQAVSFRDKKDWNAHRLLRAIDKNTLLSKLESCQQEDENDRMLPMQRVKNLFEDFAYILDNTQKLIENCQVSFSFGKGLNQNLSTYGKSRSSDEKLLRRLCTQRLPKRYPDKSQQVEDRLERELNAIIKLGFVSYFLINLDIVEYARKKEYPFIGRGSGANSIVAYILGITNVDPIELDLYFERFINPNRSSPPDFDIDFSWKDREDVTRYIFERYQYTALMGTYVRFKERAVARELGKVFGLPKENIDKLSSGNYHPEQLDQLESLVVKYSHYIQGFPNYVSVHSGGILILEVPVTTFTATFLPPKGFPTVQIDMNVAEEVGIHKFDILAQRGLSKITDAIELIRENQPGAKLLDIDDVQKFKNDENINALLKVGDCMGVFYVESPAMRGLLTKLQTDNYLNLVAASSIIRPGVSSAGMKEEFIKRHRFPEKRKEAHPILYDIMPDTYGVMVYQEDVMKVAHQFAGLDLDDADVLRRGMSGKKTSKGQMEKIAEKFRANCRDRGYDEKLTEEIWTQISSFAGYAFPKGHSASYAIESYQSLYLKCYFPLEFMVASINNGGGFYNIEVYLQEIRNKGGRVHAPCINRSDHPTVIHGNDIFLGFGYLKELEKKTVQAILETRQFNGIFKSLADFLERINISTEQLAILIKIDAFRFTGKNRYELLWEAYFTSSKQKRITHQERLFKDPVKAFQLPKFEEGDLIRTYDQLEILGFSLDHPFKFLKNKITSKLTICHIRDKLRGSGNLCGQQITIYGSLITIKRTKTSDGKYMYFGTFYDYKFSVFDTVHFPETARKYPIYGKGIYRCTGTLQNELGYLSLTIISIEKMEIMTDPRFVSNY
ncbi:DNA polymerase III subunit alpha [Zunongwangia sp.]|uniref:DNA polymerase III subunit alpha n=1 Tax=Zunongwangia sp. TaxID=1965325 RepID=UPI003AA95F21